MQTEMTQRDKKLLMYLGLFVVIVCFGYWGVRPLIMGIIETDEAIEVAQSERDINELKIIELPMLTSDNEELEENIIQARQNFYPMMTADQIDKMLTGKVLDYNLYAYDLNISISDEELESEAYIYSESYKGAQQGPLETESEQHNSLEEVEQYADNVSINPDEDMEHNASTGIYIARINMRIGGDGEVLQKLIDDLSVSKEKQLVRAYSWEDNSNIVVNDKGEFEYETERYLNLTLDIYMCEE